MVSTSQQEAESLTRDGPRRDFIELARACGGDLVFRRGSGKRPGLLGKLAGDHMAQAWTTARRLRPGDTVFADGEHNGLPFLAACFVLRKRPARVVMLGHLLSRPWKLPALWLATRLGIRGALVLHSVEQERIVRRWLGPGWNTRLVPYQVDTRFWTAADVPRPSPPLVIAVGSENRDHETLTRAADGLPIRVVIAAGSHWARSTAGAANLPPNVEYTSRALPFADLRELYRQAAIVVVAVHDVPNQSGVTTILEAMSCGKPVIVSASRGQRECITGPLMRAGGSLDPAATADRGPHVFAPGSPRNDTGLYVPVGDVAALRNAIQHLLAGQSEGTRLGTSARAAAESTFTIEAFVGALAALLAPRESPAGTPARSAVPS
jgi:glycosyltransferase involved in cell wall biosynthesis